MLRRALALLAISLCLSYPVDAGRNISASTALVGPHRRLLQANIVVLDNTGGATLADRTFGGELVVGLGGAYAEFTAPTAAGLYKIAAVSVKLRRTTGSLSPVATIQASIVEWTIGLVGGVLGAVKASTAQSVTLTSTPTLFTFTFSTPPTLAAGASYAIRLTTTGLLQSADWITTNGAFTTSPGWIPEGNALLGLLGSVTITPGAYSYKLETTGDSSVNNDPIFIGFDGKEFEFHELGDFPLLSDGSGWKAEATFAPSETQPEDEFKPDKQLSWTKTVRVVAPNGDVVTCDLPAIRPNTTRIKMTVTHAKGDTLELTPGFTSADIAGMKALAEIGLDEAGEPYVKACRISTPKWDIRAYQFSGYEAIEQNLNNGHTKAVIYYSWLNTDFQLMEPLLAPVAGLIGDTYPKHMAVTPEQQAWLKSMHAPKSVLGGAWLKAMADASASVSGLPSEDGQAGTHMRKLKVHDVPGGNGQALRQLLRVQAEWEKAAQGGRLSAGAGMR